MCPWNEQFANDLSSMGKFNHPPLSHQNQIVMEKIPISSKVLLKNTFQTVHHILHTLSTVFTKNGEGAGVQISQTPIHVKKKHPMIRLIRILI